MQPVIEKESQVDGVQVLDLIGKPEDVEQAIAARESDGYRRHKRLVRMSMEGPLNTGHKPVIGEASNEDFFWIFALLNNTFDQYAERIPTNQELDILYVLTDSTTSGVLIYDRTGLAAELRFWAVWQHRRGKGIGMHLLREFLWRCRDCKRITLWVMQGNERAIVRYQRVGFRMDGLVDQVMVKGDTK